MIPSNPDFLKWLIDVRRDFHMHPEVSHQEKRTTDKIIEILKGLDIEVQTFKTMSGAVGLIKGSGGGPTIALRADIDALPIQELNNIPYRSINDGVMHACGHDANATIMLGVAKKIVESGFRSKMTGNVKFLYQPAEERVFGAKAMIAEGVLENPKVDCVIAGHMGSDLPTGQVGIFQDQSHASADRFSLLIKGKGAHGGRPNEGIDPIVAGSFFVTHIQTIIGRNISPTATAVLTVGKFVAGDVSNVIPESAQLEGTIRALSIDTRAFVIRRLEEIVSGMEQTFGVTCDFKIHEGVPACTNDKDVATFLNETAASVLSSENVRYLSPSTGAEDFAYFALERPSAIIRIGCGNKEKNIVYPLHSPRFDIDEVVLEVGVEVFSKAVKCYFSEDADIA